MPDPALLPRRLLTAFLLSLAVLGATAQSAGTTEQPAAPADEPATSLIDLSAMEVFVRPGFSLEWTYHEPESADPAWTRLPPVAGGRSVILKDLPFAPKPSRSRLAVGTFKPEKFTLVAAFDVDEPLVASSKSVGLFLQAIGKNWEVYLNGSVIASEVYLSRAGVIQRERSIHGAIVDIDKRFLKAGRNILAIEMLGDSVEDRTGLFHKGRYLIGDYQYLLSLKNEYLDLLLIGVYFFFALYHLILFALRPANRTYLFYGLGTLAFAAYLFARTYVIDEIVYDTAVVRGLELSSLFVFFALFLAFFDSANRGKVSVFTWAYGIVSIVAAFLAPVLWGEVLLWAWAKTLIVPAAYLLVFDCAIPTAKAIREVWALPPVHRLPALAKRNEFWTLVVAYLILAFLGIAMLVDVNTRDAFVLAKFAAFVLIFGMATVLARQNTGLYRDVAGLTMGLEARVHERTAALERVMDEQSALNAKVQAANQALEAKMDAAARDMRIAVQVQQGIFPQRAPETSDWELAFVYRPVKDVSGDFYDFYEDSGRLVGAVVGDVTGHGISSGLITVLARSIFFRGFRSLGAYSLGRILEDINAELSVELSAVENYLTATLLRFDGDSVEYANAAHTDLAFRRAGKARANLVSPQAPSGFKGPPLGREGIEAPYRSIKFAVAPGDSLLVYTDSLRDAEDGEGKPFGVDGILSAYGMAPADSAADMLEYIVEEWEFHRGEVPLEDDLTAMLLRKK